jgi:hypothetical protein
VPNNSRQTAFWDYHRRSKQIVRDSYKAAGSSARLERGHARVCLPIFVDNSSAVTSLRRVRDDSAEKTFAEIRALADSDPQAAAQGRVKPLVRLMALHDR